ncbi:MAG: YfhO family protein [Patescibacteria group bacterium]
MFKRFFRLVVSGLPKSLRNNKELLIIGLFFLLPIVGFWRNMDTSGLNTVYFHVDFLGYYYPDYLQGVEVVKAILSVIHASDALWDPYNFTGFPLIGALDRVSLFYPVRFIFYLISTLLPLNLQVFCATYYSLFHLSLAGIFTYLFLRKCLGLEPFPAFLSGIIYSLGGSMIYVGIFANPISGPALFPLQLLLLYKSIENKSYKYAIFSGLVSSSLLLGGYTAFFLHNNIFIAFLLFFFFAKDLRSIVRIIVSLLLANVCGILVSAVSLLPAFELQQLAIRQHLDIRGSASMSMELRGILNYLLPYYYGSQSGPAVIGYISAAGLILVALSVKLIRQRVVASFFISAFVFALLSLGNLTFMHQAAYLFIPFYGYFRFLTFVHVYTAFSLSVLCGYGYIYLSRYEYPRNMDTWVRNFSFLFILILFMTIVANIGLKSMGKGSSDLVYLTDSIFLFFLFFIPFFLLVRFGRSINPKMLKISLVTLVLIDLFTLITRSAFINSDIDPRIFNSESSIVRKYSPEMRKNLTRAYFLEATNRFNSAVVGIYQTEGFNGLTLRDYNLLYNHYQESDWGVKPDSPLLDILAVQYIFTSKPFPKNLPDGLKLTEALPIPREDSGRFVSRNGTAVPAGTPIYVYENTNRHPMAYVVGNVVQTKTSEEALKIMDNLDLQKSAVVVTSNSIPQLDTQNDYSYANVYSYKNSNIRISAQSKGKSLLVLSNTYYPGWEAYIDGKSAQILKTNVTSRGVFLTDGQHDVEFRYVPKTLYYGGLISLISLAVSLVVAKKIK